MHLSHRFLSLLAGAAAVSVAFATYQAVSETHAQERELGRQARVLAETQQRRVEGVIASGTLQKLQPITDQFWNHDRLAGAAIFDADGKELAITPGLEARFGGGSSAAVWSAAQAARKGVEVTSVPGGRIHVFSLPLENEGKPAGTFSVFHDASFITPVVLRHALVSVGQTLLIVGFTLLLVQLSLRKPLRRMTEWLHDLRTGKATAQSAFPKEEIFFPLTTEVKQLATSLNQARAAAEEEARLRDASLSRWTPERLRVSVRSKLKDNRLFVVSNREPYEHSYLGSSLIWSVPPSGLVTALEPVLRVCDGTWVAQATGDADRKTADDHGRLRVPPDHPQYSLRRVWLSPEEEKGFYIGFANEGLWPLCHIAHTRPVFRAEDWGHYARVNEKFAAALLEEIDGESEPFVLVQDYHFALLPRIVKEKRPDARVAIFWHIPWPNPEAFGICPWQRELLDGMLGADLIGFHIQAHCNNFLETVDQALESRIDREHFAVNRKQHPTAVRPFPISVAFNGESENTVATFPSSERDGLLRELGVDAQFIGLGVDRVDYTKGIPERLRAIERLMEQYPVYRGKLTFVQIGAPSRDQIKSYQDLMVEVEGETNRINQRFRTDAWKPIVFLKKHLSHEQIQPYYRHADFCMVTSLHDGMNLVAKEYVASRHDEKGALILSRFTGASHELNDAFIINPYSVDEMAQAIQSALSMPEEEKTLRMRRMRAVVREHNVYRWADNLIAELAAIRLEPAAPPAKPQPPVAAARKQLQHGMRLAG
jgi:trehalose-6-phosphate synthase